jgi:1,4-alpha-glucan branching enzyme
MAVTRRHLMPFGAQLLDDGRVRFRLWAPGADKVELCLLGLEPEEFLMMTPEDEGWFGIITGYGSSAYYYLMLRSLHFLQFSIGHLIGFNEKLRPQGEMIGFVFDLQALQLKHGID